MGSDDSNGVADTFDEAWRRSRVASAHRRSRDRLEGTTETSRTASLVRRTRTIGGSSRLYLWCVTEPDPRVVTIDLRDSRLLGRVARRVPALLSVTGSAWQNGRVRRGWRATAGRFRHAPVRVAATLLLLIVLGSVLASLQRPTPIGAGQLAILAGLVLLGLREGRSWAEFRESRVGCLVARAFAPPEDAQR